MIGDVGFRMLNLTLRALSLSKGPLFPPLALFPPPSWLAHLLVNAHTSTSRDMSILFCSHDEPGRSAGIQFLRQSLLKFERRKSFLLVYLCRGFPSSPGHQSFMRKWPDFAFLVTVASREGDSLPWYTILGVACFGFFIDSVLLLEHDWIFGVD
jgi:hypothetical protein